MIDPIPKPQFSWLDNEGSFELTDADYAGDIYFPLVNEAGMMSAITPQLKGDLKSSQNTFFLPPVSITDLNQIGGRNFWVILDEEPLWSATGNSVWQRQQRLLDPNFETCTLQAGLLWHRTIRSNIDLGIQAIITSFIPANQDLVEYHIVRLSNTGNHKKKLSAVAAIPIFARGADSLRDHRHVTSLLNHIQTVEDGVIVHPTMTFDERGHHLNKLSYGVFGRGQGNSCPQGFYPILVDFCGPAGSQDWPTALVRNETPAASGYQFSGEEALGGLRFAPIELYPGAVADYVLALSISSAPNHRSVRETISADRVHKLLDDARINWRKQTDQLTFSTGDSEFNNWLRWVGIQPKLRRIFGCSFLPHHDYGRGGRGWRDLWQDSLALLFTDAEGLRKDLLSHFAGVRIDGSNATIIGDSPGTFIADRNNIPRVWMDHGVWPMLTTLLYIHQSGDLAFLLENQTYFQDQHLHRCIEQDPHWDENCEPVLCDDFGKIHYGSILEHLLVQHLTAFFNVGPHNHIRLEGGDWNDGLDMARTRGESVTFTAMYAGNLQELVQLIQRLRVVAGLDTVEFVEPVFLLLDILSNPVNYNNIAAKRDRLNRFYRECQPEIKGGYSAVKIVDLVQDLECKIQWIRRHIQNTEWIDSQDGLGWYNGYYDEDGEPLEGRDASGVRMTLTGQVFPIMTGLAGSAKIKQIIASVNSHLWSDFVGGPHLNTDFEELRLNMGRCFGFAYGHKENGAMFSHMAVMYAYALYRRRFSDEGWRVLKSIWTHCSDFDRSGILPGIPEYIGPDGKGLYHYLTGSASWVIFTILTQVFGLRGKWGDLHIDPQFPSEFFQDSDTVTVDFYFAERQLQIKYRHIKPESPFLNEIISIHCGLVNLAPIQEGPGRRILRTTILDLTPGKTHCIRVDMK